MDHDGEVGSRPGKVRLWNEADRLHRRCEVGQWPNQSGTWEEGTQPNKITVRSTPRTPNPERGNMRSPQLSESLTASEPISTALEDGSVVEGTLGFHPSGKGRFKVSYAGKSKMETRSYMSVEYMRSGAMILLREMADAQRAQSTPTKPTNSKSSSKKNRG